MIVARISSKTAKIIHFEASSATSITREEAREAQQALGYPPMGYSFKDFRSFLSETGEHKATWACSNSCE